MHWRDEKDGGVLHALPDVLTRPRSCLSGPCPILSLCHSDVDGFSAGGLARFLPTYKSPPLRHSIASEPGIGFILQCSFQRQMTAQISLDHLSTLERQSGKQLTISMANTFALTHSEMLLSKVAQNPIRRYCESVEFTFLVSE